MIAVACSLLQVGCLTPLAIEKYNAPRRLETARFELLVARPGLVRVAYQTTFKKSSARLGHVDFHPSLSGCRHVSVFIRDANELSRLEIGEVHSISNGMDVETADTAEGHDVPRHWAATAPPPTESCDIIILTRQSINRKLVFHASGADYSGFGVIQSPRHHAWVAVIPFAAVADVAIAASAIAGICLSALGHGDRATTWTRTP